MKEPVGVWNSWAHCVCVQCSEHTRSEAINCDLKTHPQGLTSSKETLPPKVSTTFPTSPPDTWTHGRHFTCKLQGQSILLACYPPAVCMFRTSDTQVSIGNCGLGLWGWEDCRGNDNLVPLMDCQQTALNPGCSPVKVKVLVNGLWQK